MAKKKQPQPAPARAKDKPPAEIENQWRRINY